MLITPLTQGFGAKISGFDVLRGREVEDVARLRQAFAAHNLLVFQGGADMPAERQVEIVGWFGPVLGEGTPWTVLDNAEPAGRNVLPFHSDITFVEFPLAGISLYPQELPEVDTSTTYVSNAVAWDALPEVLRRRLRGRRVRHYYDSSHDMGFDWPVFEYWHPACMAHAQTGREMLFVTEHHADRIEGMDEAEGAALLQELFAVLYAPERRYEHVWRAGELVVWDNLAVQHARTQVAEVSAGRRVMRRVQLGTKGFLVQAEAVRQKARA